MGMTSFYLLKNIIGGFELANVKDMDVSTDRSFIMTNPNSAGKVVVNLNKLDNYIVISYTIINGFGYLRRPLLMNSTKEYIFRKIIKNLNKMLIVIITILMSLLVIQIILIKNQKDSVKNKKLITKVVEKKMTNKIIERKVEVTDDISTGFVEEIEKKDYIVKKGDSIYSIVKAMGISEEVLKYNNPELNKKFYVGQKLKLFNGNYIEYIVQEGDKILSIANKFDVKVTDILRVNSLQSSNLKNGMILNIKEPNLENYNGKIAQEKINSGNLNKIPRNKNSK